jgi:hypothetical protein
VTGWIGEDYPPASSIAGRDNKEFSLNDLIVRLVAEEIAALSGDGG